MLFRWRFDTQAIAGREQLTHAEPLFALKAWLIGLHDSWDDYRGLSEFMAAVLDDETSPLYPSCHAMRAVVSQLVERAKKAGEVRADVTANEVLLLLHAVSWVGEHSPGGDGTSRLLDRVFDGLRAS